jgi:hypothetical protein
MKKPALIWLLIAIVVCVAVRTLHSGWGLLAPVADANGSLRFGIATNPSDYLSYSSWAQQARMGSWSFSDLYTTTPHAPAYVNPFFLLIGWISRAVNMPPELILNLSVFLSLFIFIYSVNAICVRLGFGSLTIFCFFCLCFGGGGVTWLRRIVELIGLQHSLRTVGPADAIYAYPDWYYAELFPALTFNLSPFHSMALALMALIAALLLRCDDPGHPLRLREVAALVAVTGFLVGMRPYEPVVLLTAWVAYLGSITILRLPRDQIKRTALLCGCLCLGILPFLAYDFWLTRQPVWHEFSEKGLDLFGGADWAGAFLFLWVLAIAGVATLGTEVLKGPYAFLVIWSSIYAAILVVLHSGFTKLCGGCTIPLSLLAAAGIEHLGKRLTLEWQRVLIAALILAFSFGSVAVVMARVARFPPPRVPADLLLSINAIRSDSKTPAPVVLTDAGNAMFLPGLAGFRVYCGNWGGLTDNYEGKFLALAGIGLSTSPVASLEDQSELVKASLADLRQQIKNGVFAYLVIDRNAAAPTLAKFRDTICRDFPSQALYQGTAFCVIKLDREVIDKLIDLIDSTSSQEPRPREKP